MRKTTILALVILACGTPSRAEAPKMPAPAKEHEFLKQFAGEWETEAEMVMEPGKPAVKSRGTESARMLGGFWLTSEMKGDCMGVTVTGHLTVGYDPKVKKYVGTWVCSMSDWLCKYEGSADGKVLTLECEGSNPTTGKAARMKDVVELKSKDHKILTSSILGEDGKWTVFMTMNAKRKK